MVILLMLFTIFILAWQLSSTINRQDPLPTQISQGLTSLTATPRSVFPTPTPFSTTIPLPTTGLQPVTPEVALATLFPDVMQLGVLIDAAFIEETAAALDVSTAGITLMEVTCLIGDYTNMQSFLAAKFEMSPGQVVVGILFDDRYRPADDIVVIEVTRDNDQQIVFNAEINPHLSCVGERFRPYEPIRRNEA